jgi:hypothetical protein
MATGFLSARFAFVRSCVMIQTGGLSPWGSLIIRPMDSPGGSRVERGGWWLRGPTRRGGDPPRRNRSNEPTCRIGRASRRREVEQTKPSLPDWQAGRCGEGPIGRERTHRTRIEARNCKNKATIIQIKTMMPLFRAVPRDRGRGTGSIAPGKAPMPDASDRGILRRMPPPSDRRGGPPPPGGSARAPALHAPPDPLHPLGDPPRMPPGRGPSCPRGPEPLAGRGPVEHGPSTPPTRPAVGLASRFPRTIPLSSGPACPILREATARRRAGTFGRGGGRSGMREGESKPCRSRSTADRRPIPRPSR